VKSPIIQSVSNEACSRASDLDLHLSQYTESIVAVCVQNEVRLSKKDYESERAKMYGPVDLWYHIDCFIAKRDELEFTTDMDPTKSVDRRSIMPICFAVCISCTL